MAKRKNAAPAATGPVEVGSLERYEVIEVHRSELKNAPYNPRVITDTEREKLAAIVRKHGLVAPATWNRRTGNLVGGHQRTAVLDMLYGTSDYRLKVAAIDVDLVREKEINLALNNTSAQGDFDMGLLEQMFKDTPELDLAGTGFDAGELFRLFGDSPFQDRADDALSDVAQKIRTARERQAQIKDKVKAREDDDFYLVVVFRDADERTAFCESVGWEDNRYQDGRQLAQIASPWVQRLVKKKEQGMG